METTKLSTVVSEVAMKIGDIRGRGHVISPNYLFGSTPEPGQPPLTVKPPADPTLGLKADELRFLLEHHTEVKHLLALEESLALFRKRHPNWSESAILLHLQLGSEVKTLDGIGTLVNVGHEGGQVILDDGGERAYLLEQIEPHEWADYLPWLSLLKPSMPGPPPVASAAVPTSPPRFAVGKRSVSLPKAQPVVSPSPPPPPKPDKPDGPPTPPMLRNGELVITPDGTGKFIRYDLQFDWAYVLIRSRPEPSRYAVGLIRPAVRRVQES